MARYIDAEHFDERVRLAVGVVFGDLTNDFKNGILATLEMLKTEPTADVQPVVRGEWVYHPEKKNVYGGKTIECSHCHTQYVVQYIEDELFCRNCGARMVEE